MKLSQLLGEVEVLTAAADLEREITGVSYDSRQTQEGDLFAAISGFAADGHKFIPMAAEPEMAANKSPSWV